MDRWEGEDRLASPVFFSLIHLPFSGMEEAQSGQRPIQIQVGLSGKSNIAKPNQSHLSSYLKGFTI
jgi:hypothetical protein